MKLGHLVNALLLAAIAILGFKSWGKLPERIPIHFGANGLPNRWTSKGGELFTLYVIPWVLTALMVGFSLVTTKIDTKWINIPNKEKFYELPPESQRKVLEAVGDMLLWVAASMNLLFLTTNAGLVLVALGRAQRLPDWAIWPGVAATLLSSLGGAVWLYQLVDRLWSVRP